MKRTFKIQAFTLLIAGWVGCTTAEKLPPSVKNQISEDVKTLSSTRMEGRKTGETGDSAAARYIRDRFQGLNLVLPYDKGIQHFPVVARVSLGNNNNFSVNGKQLELNSDYLPYSFSSGDMVGADLVFAGYGIELQSDTIQWHDYANLDVKGKWVVLLKGDPEIDRGFSPFEPFSGERSKVLTAADHGAAGVILVAGIRYSKEDRLDKLVYDKNSSIFSIPVFQVTRRVADEILRPANTTVARIEAKMDEEKHPAGFIVEGRILARADILLETVTTSNVVAYLPGQDPLLQRETIVVGAHFDHLGSGGPASGSRQPDTLAIHYGADDNASGVGLILELAMKAAAARGNRRNLLFAAFGAEEMGLLGSRTLADNLPPELGKTVAMCNFDMVGRLDSSRNLSIGGTSTSAESEEILTRLNPGFKLNLSPEGTGPSDHASFYLRNIPVFFFSTGAHYDYHTTSDTFEKINTNGIREIADYAWQVIREIDERDTPLTFTEAGSTNQSARGARFRVTLGIMPDYAGQEGKGLRVEAVTRNKPASRSGILRGDIITAINGKSVGNIYDYMNRLSTLSEGETISVDLLRNGQPLVIIVQL